MPPRKKPDTAGFEKLKQNLSEGKPGQLYMFHGEETYLRDHYLSRLREAVLTGGLGEFNRHDLSTREMSPHALEEAVDCLPMMAERTLIQITDFDLFKSGDKEEYVRILSNLPDYCCLVFVYDVLEYKPDSRTKLAAVLKEHGTVVNFTRQEASELRSWIRRHFRALGKDIDSRLCGEMIELCGDLMQNLQQEIEKIAAYAKGGQITRADIEAVATLSSARWCSASPMRSGSATTMRRRLPWESCTVCSALPMKLWEPLASRCASYTLPGWRCSRERGLTMSAAYGG